MNDLLRLENVTMQFGGVVAVNNFSMSIGKGEIVSLIPTHGSRGSCSRSGKIWCSEDLP